MKKILVLAILIVVVSLFALPNNSKKTIVVSQKENMKVTSTAFENNSKIPRIYTCDGKSISPPLSFVNIPANVKSLSLIMDDPDASMGTFVHWILFNIDPKVQKMKENSVPQSALQGKTSVDKVGYVGVCPPSGTHCYYFKLYALDTALNLTNPDKETLEKEMQKHVIDKAELIGLYSR